MGLDLKLTGRGVTKGGGDHVGKAGEVLTARFLGLRSQENSEGPPSRVDPKQSAGCSPVSVIGRAEKITEVSAISWPVQPPAETPRAGATLDFRHLAHGGELVLRGGGNCGGAEELSSFAISAVE